MNIDEYMIAYGNYRRLCWICESAQVADREWINACKCVNERKWVHKNCLDQYIDKKQNGSMLTRVVCPHCQYRYVIIYPRSGLLIKLCELVDEILNLLSPFVFGFMGVVSVYLCSATFGALTMIMVLDNGRDLVLVKRKWYVIGLVAPLVTASLYMCRYFDWHNTVIRILPIIPSKHKQFLQQQQSTQNKSKLVRISRNVVAVVLLPTISKLLAAAIFKTNRPRTSQILVSGLLFIGFKGVVKIYHKRKRVISNLTRDIKDYNHEINT